MSLSRRPIAEILQPISHLFGRQRPGKTKHAAEQVTKRSLVGDDNPRMVLSGREPFAVQVGEITDIKGHDAPRLLSTPLKLNWVGLAQTTGFRR